jgi:hypothetical protein
MVHLCICINKKCISIVKIFLLNPFVVLICILRDTYCVSLDNGAIVMNQYTFLTTNELSLRIKYDARTIREQLKDSVLIEGIHYVRPFGGRKILYVWERIESEIMNGPSPESLILGL